MAKHALLSASGAHRWLECTPSALLELQFPQSTSEYAEEGTAAHELCELTARYFLGEVSEMDFENRRDELAKGPYYNAEMQECANDYARFVTEKTKAAQESCEDAFMVKSYQNALRRLWDGLCDVYVLETAVNKANGRDEPTEVQKLHREPCRLSFSSISSTTEQDSAPLIQQSVKLFISKTVEIPAGSKIVVTQEGRTTAYARSGEPAVYSCHQEIPLVPFKEYA